MASLIEVFLMNVFPAILCSLLDIHIHVFLLVIGSTVDSITIIICQVTLYGLNRDIHIVHDHIEIKAIVSLA